LKDIVKLGAVCYQEYEKGYLDFLELAGSLDLSWVEFKYEFPLYDHYNSNNFKEIRKRADLLDIDLSMHTAFDGLNIASIDDNERTNSLRQIKKSIEAASQMEIQYATLHPGFLLSVQYSVQNWIDSQNINIESISELVNYAGGLGITLCLENGNAFKRSSLKHGLHPGDLKFIRNNVGDKLKYTVDFGHALYLSKDPSFLVSELGADLVKLSHLHSNSGLVDSHCPLGTGVLELEKLIIRCIGEGWNFPVSVEMKSEINLVDSLKVLREVIEKI
jgi:sugar phosphate isomerase/epimerase